MVRQKGAGWASGRSSLLGWWAEGCRMRHCTVQRPSDLHEAPQMMSKSMCPAGNTCKASTVLLFCPVRLQTKRDAEA